MKKQQAKPSWAENQPVCRLFHKLPYYKSVGSHVSSSRGGTTHEQSNVKCLTLSDSMCTFDHNSNALCLYYSLSLMFPMKNKYFVSLQPGSPCQSQCTAACSPVPSSHATATATSHQPPATSHALCTALTCLLPCSVCLPSPNKRMLTQPEDVCVCSWLHYKKPECNIIFTELTTYGFNKSYQINMFKLSHFLFAGRWL